MGGCFGSNRRRTIDRIVEKPSWERVASARGMPLQLPDFEPHDKTIVAESWKLLRSIFPDLIESAFVEMCRRVPRLKLQFGNVDVDDDEERHMNFLKHVWDVSFFFDQLLLYLPFKSKLEECSFHIGLVHASVEVPAWYVDLFLVEFIRAAQETVQLEWTPAMENAWAVFLRYLCYYMKDAMIF
ncbi:hypothetical protein C0Q70_02930 [Pomacea canaliculata]|uniref:Globin n=1 Tax=Pomacea canaliculata TaxID=400727 RepID=A0A2T7PRA6_POMCA|nr:hypothetical protein C0Q70_02930 [Pomacea canaliculata]